MRGARLAFRRRQQERAQSAFAVVRVERQRVQVEAAGHMADKIEFRPERWAQFVDLSRIGLTGQPVAQHHSGDMAAALTDEGMLQTEGLGALGKSMGREVHEIGDAAGLSGEARRLIVHQHDQLGKRG